MTSSTQSDAPPRGAATATARLRPPAVPPSVLRRERLLERLETTLERRLTTVVAGAGFGKSTLLAVWGAGVNCAWYSAASEDSSLVPFCRGLADALRLRVPALSVDGAGGVVAASPGPGLDEAARARGFVAAVCEVLQTALRRDLVLVIDDVHELEASSGALLAIESLCRQSPSRLHVVLASRTDLPFPIERLRGQGQVLELSSADLAFDMAETRALLETYAAPGDAPTAVALLRITGGWPAATRMAVEVLRGVPTHGRAAALERIVQPDGPLIAYLAVEVFARERREVERLVRRVAPLERFTPALCEALGIEEAATILRSLARRGLFVELQGDAAGWYALGAPVREFALARSHATDEETATVRREAARWFRDHDEPEEALRCLVAAGDTDEIAGALPELAPGILARGSLDTVLDAVARLGRDRRSSEHEFLAGEALRLRGDWEGALRCFERAAGRTGPVPPALAWRLGLLHHLGGRLDEAVAAYDRADEDGEPADVALVLAWRAAAHWLGGARDACAADAERAYALAFAANDPRALAAAHTALAMLAALDGDGAANDLHYLRALDYAQQAGDVLQLIRVRTNRGSRHIEECAYEEAIAELDLALRLADLAGFAAFRGLALSNRGEALACLGRFDEAVADLEAARDLYRRLGSRMVAYPLVNLGHVYRWRGQLTLARAAYDEAVAHSEASSDLQGLVPALTGLARVAVADDTDEAAALVHRALELSHGMHDVDVLVTAGLVALARGERARAASYASESAALARARRDLGGLAESLEVGVLAAERPAAALGRLDEAVEIFRAVGNPVGEARAELERALLTGDEAERTRIEERLGSLGARGYGSALSLFLPVASDEAITVQSLGRFRVLRRGSPIPLAAWQSRKARDLFKILVARRGRPVPRDALMEALWPGQRSAPLGNRLSVLLSTVRGVLDPEKRFDPDHFVAADRGAVWLEHDHVSLDVTEFLSTADAALALHRAGHAEAHTRLAETEAAYTGDFLEEDAYEEWAIGIREECRAVYAQVVRTLAEEAQARADTDSATRFYLRLLERDPYDESAHLDLVTALETAGRHGEARRRFRAYSARMDELGVEPAPFPPVDVPSGGLTTP